jgi:uncharacterized alpha-E superfamily protein
MSRYIERAENVARIVDVNLQLLLDYQSLDDDKLKEHWEPIVRSTGDEELFYTLYDSANSQTVTDFLTFNAQNPNSIVSCLTQARENARTVRDQISTEMWEEINRLYLYVTSLTAKKGWKYGPYDFYQEVKQGSHLFQGITETTIPRREAWEFIQVGKFLERADKTTRILDIKYHNLRPGTPEGGGASHTMQGAAVLRSCSAYQAYRQIYVADVDPWRIAEFLILSEQFPRSIHFCMAMLNASLRRISGNENVHFSNLAEKLAGRLLSELNFSTIDDIAEQGLHEYLDELQEKFNEIGLAIFKTYMFYPVTDLTEEIQQQQQQQQ